MENLCSNKIIVIGHPDRIKEIILKIGSIPVDTKQVLFKTLIGDDSDYERGGLFESNLRQFGTKWDVSPQDCHIEFSNDRITMSPKTAGSPPIPFCVALAQEYDVEVEIFYFEPVSDYAGRNYIFSTGDIVEEEDYSYLEGLYYLNKEEFWNEIGQEYIDDETLKGRTLERYVDETFTYVDTPSKNKIIELLTLVKERTEEDPED